MNTEIIYGMLFFLGALLVFIIAFYIRPRFDLTEENELLLWYGQYKRKYISIFKF